MSTTTWCSCHVPSSPVGVDLISDVLGGNEVDVLGRSEAGVVMEASCVGRQPTVRGWVGVHGCCEVHSCTMYWGMVRVLI